MDQNTELTTLIRDVSAGTISRRAFMRRALALGISMTAAGSILAACSRPSEPTGDKAAGDMAKASGDKATGDEAKAAGAAAQTADKKLEGELRIYNWSDYIAEDTIPNFSKEFGVKVIYDTYESSGEALAKLQAGASGYDLMVPSSYSVPVLAGQGLIQKLDPSMLPNYKNVASLFRGQYYDPKNEYAVPWQWGITGLAYRKDKVKGPIDSWSVFHDPQYKNKITQLDEMRDVIGCWLKYRGNSVNSTVAEELAKAKEDALKAKSVISSYVSATVKGQLVTGDVWIAQLWNGDTAQAQAESDDIAFAIPKEGTSLWVDTMVIPKGAPNPNAAHAFLNYILRPEVGAAVSDFTGYGSPNQEALGKMKSPVPFPTEEEQKILEFQKDLGEASALWDKVWTEIKAG